MLMFCFYCSVFHRVLHSFPTRRSSDLLVSTQVGFFFLVAALMILRSQTGSMDFASFAEFLGTQSSLRDVTFILQRALGPDRKSTRLNSSHTVISYAVFCLKKKKNYNIH